MEINITNQFVDCNPLFEFEFDEDIIDFKFDSLNKVALILHETHVVELNKNTNCRTELAWFEFRALRLCVDNDFGLFDYQPDRSRGFKSSRYFMSFCGLNTVNSSIIRSSSD